MAEIADSAVTGDAEMGRSAILNSLLPGQAEFVDQRSSSAAGPLSDDAIHVLAAAGGECSEAP